MALTSLVVSQLLQTMALLPGDGYGYKSGISMAAAYVSATAALVLTTVTDANGDGLVNDEVVAILEMTFDGPHQCMACR